MRLVISSNICRSLRAALRILSFAFSTAKKRDKILMILMIFTALHLCRAVLAMSEMSVCLSVRSSVKRVNSEKNERNVCQNSYTL